MTADGTTGAAVLAAALLTGAVLLWPTERPGRGAARVPAPEKVGEAGAAAGPLWVGVRRWLARDLRIGRQGDGWVAEFAELAAVGLDAGLPSAQAAELACAVGAGRHPEARALGERLRAAEVAGAGVGDCLATHSRQPGSRTQPGGVPGAGGHGSTVADRGDLAFLATAWQLTDEFGVAAAPAARTAAQVLRERAAAHQRRTVLAAGPRASMWLLTLLPLSGPVVTVLLGLPVGRVYAGVAALTTTIVGLVLTGAGWLWSRRLLRRALRPSGVA